MGRRGPGRGQVAASPPLHHSSKMVISKLELLLLDLICISCYFTRAISELDLQFLLKL